MLDSLIKHQAYAYQNVHSVFRTMITLNKMNKMKKHFTFILFIFFSVIMVQKLNEQLLNEELIFWVSLGKPKK